MVELLHEIVAGVPVVQLRRLVINYLSPDARKPRSLCSLAQLMEQPSNNRLPDIWRLGDHTENEILLHTGSSVYSVPKQGGSGQPKRLLNTDQQISLVRCAGPGAFWLSTGFEVAFFDGSSLTWHPREGNRIQDMVTIGARLLLLSCRFTMEPRLAFSHASISKLLEGLRGDGLPGRAVVEILETNENYIRRLTYDSTADVLYGVLYDRARRALGHFFRYDMNALQIYSIQKPLSDICCIPGTHLLLCTTYRHTEDNFVLDVCVLDPVIGQCTILLPNCSVNQLLVDSLERSIVTISGHDVCLVPISHSYFPLMHCCDDDV